jgi:hypothetical protein
MLAVHTGSGPTREMTPEEMKQCFGQINALEADMKA